MLRFDEDGTFSGSVGPKEERLILFSGTWSCSKDRIIYSYRTPKTGHDEDQILAITSHYFVIRALSGDERRYDRMQNKPNQTSEPTAPSGRGSP